MKIAILGSGNVATHLSKALQAIGEDLVQVYSPNIEHAKILAEPLGASAINHLNEVVKDADLYIISVKDDAIAAVAEGLKGANGIVVHTSGTTDSNILSSKFENAGVLYPLQTFSKSKEVSFERIPLCVEANTDHNFDVLNKLAHKLSNQVYHLDAEKRRVLHLAAVFACNFTNHMYALANELLVKNNLDFEIIKPLIAETADKVMANLPENVQTGPAIREDNITIKKHLDMLSDLPELQEIYQKLSNSIKISHK
ncbi:DUF2520 domain-containing protein [Pedobacter yonginense]|uniref:DUF2520 domain-containing protein n=1 Tax=Pedobacter yonginense TaxID=651869 RepID=A0A317EP65_9SPHI|nr:Rossmann-like and DUF2520 domain-containing protein [Pedobacter yonginense]PWS28394.1 DUF2520 domain-containing protein [Pedobacter yonginense]